MAAALRGRELFQQSGLAVRVLSLPDGLDPDQVVRERGREAFAALIEAAVPMIEWELARIYERVAAADEVTRMEGMKEAAATLARLPAAIEREYYIRWMVGKWGAGSPSQAAAMEAAVREEIAQLAARRRETGRRTEQPAQGADDVNKQAAAPRKLAGAQADLLAALVRHGELGRPYLEQLSPEDFPEDARDIFAAVRSLTEEGEEISAQSVLAELPERARPLLAQLMLGAVPDERAGEAMASAVARIVEGRLKRQVAELSERFREAKSAEEQERIGKELAQIGIERSKLTKRRTIGEE
jgi:DNA primase